MILKASPEAVIKCIEKIPGQKIITLMSPNSVNQMMTIDLSADGAWGYEPAHLAMFKAKLVSAINSEYGSVTIRQFLPTLFSEKIPNKIIYGIIFNKGEMRAIRPDHLADVFEHDNSTGKYIGKEDGVTYGDVSEYLAIAD